MAELLIEPDVLRRAPQPIPAPYHERGRQLSWAFAPSFWHQDARSAYVFPSEALDADEPAGRNGVYGQDDATTERRISWPNALAAIGAGCWAAILGPPGQGKSLLVDMSVRKLAAAAFEAFDTQQQLIDSLPLPLVTTAPALTQRGILAGESPEAALRRSIRDALAEAGFDAPTCATLADHTHEPHITLFIDALDQIDDNGWTTLEQFLHQLSKWRTRVILTSRPYGWRPGGRVAHLTEYRLAPLTNFQIQRFVETWSAGRTSVTPVRELLTRSAAVRRLASVPFLLTLICWAAERHKISGEVTRTELYEMVVRDLLSLHPELSHIDVRRANDWLAHLSAVALALFQETDGGRSEAILDSRLAVLIEKDTTHRPAPLAPAATDREKARSLIDELTAKRVLVFATPDKSVHEFAHRSIWEYLAATALADGIAATKSSNPAWLADNWDLWHVLDKKAWDPAWHGAIQFVAGRLSVMEANGQSPPGALRRLIVEVLSNENTDDAFHHRLALAATCLTEISGRLESAATWKNEIAVRAVSVWTQHVLAGTTPVVAAVERALPTAVSATCPMAERQPDTRDASNVLDELLQRLNGEDVEVFAAARQGKSFYDLYEEYKRLISEAARALGALGPYATRNVVQALVFQLQESGDHEKDTFRSEVAAALGGLGASAGDDVINALLVCLTDQIEHLDVVGYASEAVARLASDGVDTERLVSTLLGRLLDRRDNVFFHRNVARGFRALALPPAAAEPVVGTLLDGLGDMNDDVEMREGMAYALAAMGPQAAVHRQLVPTLLSRLEDTKEYSEIRFTAAGALASVARYAVADEGFVDRLFRQFSNPQFDPLRRRTEATPNLVSVVSDVVYLRSYVADAIGTLGALVAPRADVIKTLMARLTDPAEDFLVREHIAEALLTLSPFLLDRDDFVDPLLHLLKNNQAFVSIRRTAATILAQFARHGRQGQIVSELLARLSDRTEDTSLREGVAKALSAVRGADGDGLVAPILSIVEDPMETWSVRTSLIEALGTLGSSTRTVGKVVATLARLLDGDAFVGTAAANALGALGPGAAAHDTVVASLLSRVNNPLEQANMRTACAKAIAAWHEHSSGGLRLFLRGGRTSDAWLVLSTRELSRV